MIDCSLAGSLSVDSLRHSFFTLPFSTTQQRGSSVQRSIGGGSSTLFHGITFNLSGTSLETPLSLVVVPLFLSVRFVRRRVARVDHIETLSLCLGPSRTGSMIEARDESMRKFERTLKRRRSSMHSSSQ